MRKIYLPERLKEGSEFWDNCWSKHSLEEIIQDGTSNYMNPIFLKYFPKQGKILEAGCGLGKFVIYYRNMGYDIEGIDFAKDTIIRLKKYDSTLPVKIGDLASLNCVDGYYAVYYSGGVIEHYEEFAQPILKEAHRVLKKDGLLIITVPCMNFTRQTEDFIWFRILRKKYKIETSAGNIPVYYIFVRDCYTDNDGPKGWIFHKYVYNRDEIIKLLRKNGFRPIFSKYIQIQWGIKTVNWVRNLIEFKEKSNRSHYFNLVKKYLLREDRDSFFRKILTSIIGFFFANQLVFVCKKVSE